MFVTKSRVGNALRHPGSMLVAIERRMKKGRTIYPSEGFFGRPWLDAIMTFGVIPAPLLSLLWPSPWGFISHFLPIIIAAVSWTYFWIAVYPHRFDRIVVHVEHNDTLSGPEAYRGTFCVEAHVDDPVCFPENQHKNAPIFWVWRRSFFGTNRYEGLRYTLTNDGVLLVLDREGTRLHVGQYRGDAFDCSYFLFRLAADMRGIAKMWGIEYAWRFVMAELVAQASFAERASSAIRDIVERRSRATSLDTAGFADPDVVREILACTNPEE